MKQCLIFAVLSVLALQSFGVPNNDRVKESKPLSHTDHYDADGNHNAGYDHDAFLGEDESKSFSGLTEEQSKEKLGTIIDKIDKDRDGSVNEKELSEWIEKQQSKFIYKDSDHHWKIHDVNGDGTLTWAEYNQTTYSSLPLSTLIHMPEDEVMHFAKRVHKDKTRWAAADVNKDENLDYEEFVAFIHAEERKHMYDVYTREQMDEIDKDRDGKLSVDEYIADIYKRPAEGVEEDPDWVKQERESFGIYRDRNGDGFMDFAEVKEWLIPTEYSAAEAEAKHLIYESDKNKDKMLSREEIMEQWETFVPSRALMAERDEL
ncbi:calumenin-B-like [Amphiura filiformis]|uniref:calumenin-B-like n=1 Tax=Amphiura filiformis TaxID=82378 RepID=UPI003B2191E5